MVGAPESARTRRDRSPERRSGSSWHHDTRLPGDSQGSHWNGVLDGYMQREGEPMDEHDAPTPPSPSPYDGAPDAAAASSTRPMPARRDSPCRRPSRGAHSPRLVAAGTAVALVVAAGGAGFALGHHRGGTDSAGGRAGGGYAFGQRPGFGEGGTAPFGGTPFNGPGQQGAAPVRLVLRRHPGQRRPAHRPGPDRHDAEVPGRPGRRHRHDPHQHRRGRHQPPRRGGCDQDPGHGDEHRAALPRDRGRHRRQGRRGRAPAEQRERPLRRPARHHRRRGRRRRHRRRRRGRLREHVQRAPTAR